MQAYVAFCHSCLSCKLGATWSGSSFRSPSDDLCSAGQPGELDCWFADWLLAPATNLLALLCLVNCFTGTVVAIRGAMGGRLEEVAKLDDTSTD